MRVSESGRVRRTREEWQEIAERFEQSGLSLAGFCKREGIAEGSFAKWRKRLQDEERASVGGFVECSVAQAAPTPHELELSLPGGVVLRWKL